MDRGIEYLARTTSEFGLDVVVMLEIVGEMTGSRHARAVASARKPMLRASELARHGRLFEIAKPPLPPGSLEGVASPVGVPDPSMPSEPGEDIDRWLGEILRCRFEEAALRFVRRDDRWGRVLTHQGAWLLFRHWAGCTVPLDVELTRRRIAARLLAESRADARFSETFLERLAVLGHLGYARYIDRAWIDEVVRRQQPDGGWPVIPGGPSHPHSTGLALWTLGLAKVSGLGAALDISRPGT